MQIGFYRCVTLLSERGGEKSGGGVQAADGKFPRRKLHPDMAAPERRSKV